MTEKNVVGAGRKDDEFPIFKSDIMDEESYIKPVAATNLVTPLSPVSIDESSIDAVEEWREMSENQKKVRLAKLEANSQNVQVKKEKDKDSFQEDYEHDSLDISGAKKHEENFLSEFYRKIQTANTKLDSNSLVKLEPKKDEETEEKLNIKDLENLKVSDVMTKHVICVMDSTTIEQVASIFNIHNIRGVPVIDYKTRKLVGAITISEIFSNAFKEKVVSTLNINQTSFFNFDETLVMQHTLAILEKPVGDFMKTNVLTVSVDTKITDACKFMVENKVRRVIVTKDEIVKGIFSAFDAVKILSNYT